MPRKPKREKQTITVVVNAVPITVTLHPPAGGRKSWYAYWPGQVTSKSTGQNTLPDAIVVAENMVKNGGKRATAQDAVLTDDEFEQLQKVHFDKKTDPNEQVRAAKSLKTCLEAIAAFKAITGLQPITLANADDCAAFQRKALMLPKNWRHQYPKSKKDVSCLSPNTVLKWSRALQAAFERANRNASKKKSVRGVVDAGKLLVDNPWNHFPWVEGRKRPIRQFDGDELLSLLKHLESRWPGVTVAQSLARLCLWSSCRRAEVVSLAWTSLRVVGNEYHFEVVGKWGIEKWVRIPEGLYRELLQIKTDSSYLFAAYNGQVRSFYERSPCPWKARAVGAEFQPANLGDWFHERIIEWSESLPKGRATPHIFRKTSLQYARTGEDVNRQVAADARVSEGVMLTSYVKETDEEMRQRSNRTFHRMLASLPPEVAHRYGQVEPGKVALEERLKSALAAKDWRLVTELSSQLAAQ